MLFTQTGYFLCLWCFNISFLFLQRNWATIWRNVKTTKHCSKSWPMPLLWLSVWLHRPHRGEFVLQTTQYRPDVNTWRHWMAKYLTLSFLYFLPVLRLTKWNWIFVWFFYFIFSRSLLSEDELKQLEEACDMALELNQSKHRIYEYVESRMSFIAPNLSIIVGASTAAKIMGENIL